MNHYLFNLTWGFLIWFSGQGQADLCNVFTTLLQDETAGVCMNSCFNHFVQQEVYTISRTFLSLNMMQQGPSPELIRTGLKSLEPEIFYVLIVALIKWNTIFVKIGCSNKWILITQYATQAQIKYRKLGKQKIN